VIPKKAQEIWRAIGGSGSVHDQRLAELPTLDPSGWSVTKTEPIFPRPHR